VKADLPTFAAFICLLFWDGNISGDGGQVEGNDGVQVTTQSRTMTLTTNPLLAAATIAVRKGCWAGSADYASRQIAPPQTEQISLIRRNPSVRHVTGAAFLCPSFSPCFIGGRRSGEDRPACPWRFPMPSVSELLALGRHRPIFGEAPGLSLGGLAPAATRVSYFVRFVDLTRCVIKGPLLPVWGNVFNEKLSPGN
jgi:hypothetical protein